MEQARARPHSTSSSLFALRSSQMERATPSSSARQQAPWPFQKCKQAVAVGAVLVVAVSIFTATRQPPRTLVNGRSSDCQFPAVFNFGDSNSDTGCDSALFHPVPYPNGRTFFGKPSGRVSDGRLIIDFITEKLGLPNYLSAYADSIGTDFRHGANFAASGATVRPLDGKMFESGLNPFSLQTQLLQFKQFKDRTLEVHKYNQAKSLVELKITALPRPEDFSKSLYTMDAGQNDLHTLLLTVPEEEVQASISDIVHYFGLVVEGLYGLGARTFWIHNTGPLGCLPYSFLVQPPKTITLDRIGCIQSYNAVAQEFNKQLKEKVFQLKAKLRHVVVTYVDIYSAKYSLISNAEMHGFVNPLGYCCGHFGDYNLGCWQTTVNGTEVPACSNPSQYISWDTVHYTEAANYWVANLISNGSVSDPPRIINRACHRSVMT